MRILFISRWYPYPPNNGAKLRILHLLRGLAQLHEVNLLSFSDNPAKDEVDPQMRDLCREVRVVPWKEYQPDSWRSILGIFSLTPRSQADTYSEQMEAEIKKQLLNQRFDLIITSEWQMVAYRSLFSGTPVLFEEIEVGVPYGHYRNAASLPARIRGGLTWGKHRLFLARILRNNQICTVVSEEEKRLLSTIVSGNRSIYVIPNGVSLEEYKNIAVEPEANSIIFTGSFRYRPNYEAMVWFIEKVFPLIQKQIPDASLTITGDHCGLALPDNPKVRLTGFVNDVRPLIARSAVSVAPLLEGGGTRLKILEALAIGTAVVCTSKGGEGLDVEDGKHLFIADSPEEFAHRVILLLQDPQAHIKLARNGKQLIQERYDWAVIMPRFHHVVQTAARSWPDETRAVQERRSL